MRLVAEEYPGDVGVEARYQLLGAEAAYARHLNADPRPTQTDRRRMPAQFIGITGNRLSFAWTALIARGEVSSPLDAARGAC